MSAAPLRSSAIRLSTLLGEIGLGTASDPVLSGITLDSREIAPGYLFCALHGTRSHGLEFAAQAAASGAAAILTEAGGAWGRERIDALAAQLEVPVVAVERLSARLSLIAGAYFGHPSRALDVVAATGTNGKTSVCQFVAQALAHERCGVIGTVGYGFPGALQPATHTTPGAVRLQAILSDLHAQGARAVAMEVSSHALDQGRAAGVAVDTAVFTNLTRDHLDYHDDMLDYALAKRRLFHMPGLSHAVLNADDPFTWEILPTLEATVEPVLYGLHDGWQPGERRWLRAQTVTPGPRGMRIAVTGSWGEGEFESRLLGRFNAANLMAALGVLLLREPGLERALNRLQTIRGVPGRMERFGRSDQPMVVVDYAHTPDALEQVLKVLREHRPRRLVTLFGCGGDRDRGKRPLMAAVAERYSDRVIVTDDNPRSENGDAIVADILAGMQRPEGAEVERDRARAIALAVAEAGVGDIVLVAGKGHETTQKIGAVELPFSDRQQVARALELAEVKG